MAINTIFHGSLCGETPPLKISVRRGQNTLHWMWYFAILLFGARNDPKMVKYQILVKHSWTPLSRPLVEPTEGEPSAMLDRFLALNSCPYCNENDIAASTVANTVQKLISPAIYKKWTLNLKTNKVLLNWTITRSSEL